MASDNVRQRIVEAAGKVFAARGFDSATVRNICDAAGVNVASVNYYFGDKQRLYLETVRQARGRRVDAVPMPQWTSDTPPEEKLSGFIRVLLERMLGAGPGCWESQLMLREVVRPTSACKELVEDHFRPHFHLLLEILDELVPADTSQQQRRQIAFSIIGQCLFYRVAPAVVGMLTPAEELEPSLQPAELAQHISQWSLAALAYASSPTCAAKHPVAIRDSSKPGQGAW